MAELLIALVVLAMMGIVAFIILKKGGNPDAW